MMFDSSRIDANESSRMPEELAGEQRADFVDAGEIAQDAIEQPERHRPEHDPHDAEDRPACAAAAFTLRRPRARREPLGAHEREEGNRHVGLARCARRAACTAAPA